MPSDGDDGDDATAVVVMDSPDRLCDSAIHKLVPPAFTRHFVRLWLVFAHIMFFLGQTRVMWYLYSQITADVTVHADSLASQLVFKAAGVHNPYHAHFTAKQVLEEFTYMDAIRGLWLGRTGPPNPLYDQTPGFWGKFSAFLLIAFSAVWPHVKLLWLNVEFHRSVKHDFDRRTNTLYWLDTFGKWSLADVFVICTLLAVLNVDIPISGPDLLAGVVYQFDEIKRELSNETSIATASLAVCAQLLALPDCDLLPVGGGKCAQCVAGLKLAFPRVPALLSAVETVLSNCHCEGAVLAEIRVKGQSGIYFFCVATLCSLGLSWAVDVVDHRMRKVRSHHHEQRQRRFHQDPLLSSTTMDPLLSSTTTTTGDEPAPAPPPTCQRLPTRARTKGMRRTNNLVLALATATLVALAAFLPIVERRVPGSVMSLVEADFHVSLHKQYRLVDLVLLTGEAQQWDWLLMVTLGSFILLGPLLRALVLFGLVWSPLPDRVQRRLAFASSSLGVLAAWDVLIVAFAMVTLEMPRITQGIISPKLQVCRFLHALGLAEYCISIEFVLLPGFFLLPLATGLLLVCAARVTRMTYFVFDPYGDGYAGAPPVVSQCVRGDEDGEPVE